MHAFSAACRRKTVNGVSSVLPIPCGGLQKSPLLFVALTGLLIAAGALFLLFAGTKSRRAENPNRNRPFLLHFYIQRFETHQNALCGTNVLKRYGSSEDGTNAYLNAQYSFEGDSAGLFPPPGKN
jgi:hypothetical protein